MIEVVLFIRTFSAPDSGQSWDSGDAGGREIAADARQVLVLETMLDRQSFCRSYKGAPSTLNTEEVDRGPFGEKLERKDCEACKR